MTEINKIFKFFMLACCTVTEIWNVLNVNIIFFQTSENRIHVCMHTRHVLL